MDRNLIEYLRSGKAWVLVGSGPSSAMGYPSWYSLAKSAIDYSITQGHEPRRAQQILGENPPDFPAIFEEVAKIITMPVLLRELRNQMKPSNSSSCEIYDIISEWPIPVYLTTNYDDELQAGLTRKGECYQPYDNRKEHMALLSEDLSGAIVKIHGDLRSEDGLILTSSQYRAIETDERFLYWRERMKAIMQMKSIVVLGHSLTDSNIRQVLEIAKVASGVERPVCWIADNVSVKEAESYLHKYRVRVISYSNSDGRHEGLLPLLKTVSRFIPPRSRVVLHDSSIVKNSPSRASTTALHVYNRSEKDVDRGKVILAAIEGSYFKLKAIEPFTLKEALAETGWAADVDIDSEMMADLEALLLELSYVELVEAGFVTTATGEAVLSDKNAKYEHDKKRFLQQLRMRINSIDVSKCLSEEDLESLPAAIEQSLSFYFEKAGLSFATMLNDHHKLELPICVVEHIRAASTQYADYNARQLFCCVTLDMFCEPRDAEKAYVGRVAEGFLTYHALGVFGVVYNERMSQLASTVWLLDSNVLIHLVSEGYTAGVGVRECVKWLNQKHVQLYTTENLFKELMGHLKFAFKIIEDHGENSVQMMAAATGASPYHKSNAFLQGYLEVKARGGVGGWENHCLSVFNTTGLSTESVRDLLLRLGVEVLGFSDWPGFNEIRDYGMQQEYVHRIVERCKTFPSFSGQHLNNNEVSFRDPYEKAKPESEALCIIKGERSGVLDVSSRGDRRAAWFVSDTSLLNAVFDEDRVTWPPIAFEMHISSLLNNAHSEDVAFSAVVEMVAQSGYAVISPESMFRSFSGLIDEETLSVERERCVLEENLSDKYSESPDKVLARLSPIDRPLAAQQLKTEALSEEVRRRRHADERAEKAEKKADENEKKLKKVSAFTLKQMAKKEEQAKRQKRKQKSGAKKNKKKEIGGRHNGH